MHFRMACGWFGFTGWMKQGMDGGDFEVLKAMVFYSLRSLGAWLSRLIWRTTQDDMAWYGGMAWGGS